MTNENHQTTKRSRDLIDTLMPTTKNYDENGQIRNSGERISSFDTFLQSLDDDYDKRRKEVKKKSTQKPNSEKKTNQIEPAQPLSLDGPIVYRDQRKKTSKSKKAPVQPAIPVVQDKNKNDSEEEKDQEKEEMVYDEDEAW